MVVIRLARGGARNRPFYNVVVADKRNRRDGRFVERIGFYNPKAITAAETLRLDLARLQFWREKGAIASDAVEKLAKRAATAITAPVAA